MAKSPPDDRSNAPPALCCSIFTIAPDGPVFECSLMFLAATLGLGSVSGGMARVLLGILMSSLICAASFAEVFCFGTDAFEALEVLGSLGGEQKRSSSLLCPSDLESCPCRIWLYVRSYSCSHRVCSAALSTVYTWNETFSLPEMTHRALYSVISQETLEKIILKRSSFLISQLVIQSAEAVIDCQIKDNKEPYKQGTAHYQGWLRSSCQLQP